MQYSVLLPPLYMQCTVIIHITHIYALLHVCTILYTNYSIQILNSGLKISKAHKTQSRILNFIKI